MQPELPSRAQPPPSERTILGWLEEMGRIDGFLAAVETRRRHRRRRRRRLALGLLGASAALVTGFWAVPYFRQTAAIETPDASRQAVALADGSRAELNAQTSLRTDFRYGRRRVQLNRGEAFFTVAKDPRRPFLVETSAGTIRVTGTKFDVQLTRDGETEVTLVEGTIRLQRAGRRDLELRPGQQFDSRRSELRTLSPSEVDDIQAWRSGRLACDGLSLAEVAQYLSAWHHCTIAVAPDAAALKLGGSLPVDDLATALRAMEVVVEVAVTRESDGSYRIAAK